MFIVYLWKFLSTLSVISFVVDLLKKFYYLTKKKEVIMNKTSNQSSGVNMGVKHKMRLLPNILLSI